MLSLASKLQFHPKIAPETISEGLKFKPDPPMSRASRASYASRVNALCAPFRPHDFIAQKRSPPDQTKIASYGPVS